MRLQVFISHSGICSRRAAFDLIKRGKVSVNNCRVNEPSFSVEPQRDIIALNGKRVSFKTEEYVLLNKPKGVVATRQDKHASRTVYDCLPAGMRHLFSVGRLDQDSQGLLLFTNDGELAFRLMHPRFLVWKEYEVSLDCPLQEADKASLERGINLDNQCTSPAVVLSLNRERTRCKISIREGKKRQIRRMFCRLGYQVLLLKRVAYGPLKLGNLALNSWRVLNADEVAKLRKCVGLIKGA
jgi:pseudouridine synthase